jgi:hypothetical protein
MKVVRVLSVSPTFQKLELGSTETAGGHLRLETLLHSPPRHTFPLFPSPPSQVHLLSLPSHREHQPPHLPSAPHLMACSWLRGGRHLERIPRIRSSTLQPAEGAEEGASELAGAKAAGRSGVGPHRE